MSATYKPVTLNCSCWRHIINVLLTELSRSVWENLNLGRVYRPHCVRSVLTTSVKILPYRPPARLIRANYNSHTEKPVRQRLCKWEAKMPDAKFRSEWIFTRFTRPVSPIYRKRRGRVRPDHNFKMAVKNFNWKLRTFSTQIFRLEILDYPTFRGYLCAIYAELLSGL